MSYLADKRAINAQGSLLLELPDGLRVVLKVVPAMTARSTARVRLCGVVAGRGDLLAEIGWIGEGDKEASPWIERTLRMLAERGWARRKATPTQAFVLRADIRLEWDMMAMSPSACATTFGLA